jgi:hypothetical protein
VKDVHTEHCCSDCGCKYGDMDCTVFYGNKEQDTLCGNQSVCYIDLDHRAEVAMAALERGTDEDAILQSRVGELEDEVKQLRERMQDMKDQMADLVCAPPNHADYIHEFLVGLAQE